MIERRTIVFDHELLAGVEHPFFDARGAAKEDADFAVPAGRNPRSSYSSIPAVIRVMDGCDTTELHGTDRGRAGR